MRELEPIRPEALHSVWWKVRAGLEEVKKHSTDDWIAEDVYAAIRSGTSLLFVGYLDNAYCGFVVMTPFNTYASRVLHIWCCYSATKRDVINLFADDLEMLARRHQAKKLTFHSPRRGWEERLKEYGYHPVQTIFEKEVL